MVKGMRDVLFDDLRQRMAVERTLIECFEEFGGEPMDTPVPEIVRAGLDHDKLIFELKDQGGEALFLRYDLTVPLMRVLTSERLDNVRRYQLGKVYRRDQLGRFREFEQADFDIVGRHPAMTAEADLLRLIGLCMSRLEIADYEVLVNDRRVLNRILEESGFPRASFHAILSSIDKLDKMSREEVEQELCEKGLAGDAGRRLIGRLAMREPLRQSVPSMEHEQYRREWARLVQFLEGSDVIDHIQLDYSLARGLDYYTGLVVEVKIAGFTPSIIGGGCYEVAGRPAAGFSFGVDRFTAAVRVTPDARCSVGLAFTCDLNQAMFVASQLRAERICVDHGLDSTASLSKQLRKLAKKHRFVVVIRDAEAFQLKDLASHQSQDIDRLDLLLDALRGCLTMRNAC